jgi:hypothetical protein
VHWGCYYDTALDIEVDPRRCCFVSSQSDFALQTVVECHACDVTESSILVKKRIQGGDCCPRRMSLLGRMKHSAHKTSGLCVFITAGPITKLFAGGGGGEWRTCAMRDDEPRPVCA